jgi:hypothetical protein
MIDRVPFAMKFAVPFAAPPLNSSLLVIQLPSSPPMRFTGRAASSLGGKQNKLFPCLRPDSEQGHGK